MSSAPENPKIYHITHVDNLQLILRDGVLWSDADRLRRNSQATVVGMATIKQRRLTEIPVSCHPDTMVGDYVPFYFCPRSVMLYMLYQGNHPELTFHGGQSPIVHLEADLHQVIAWAKQNSRRWAFTLSNAGARYVEFRADIAQIEDLNWDAIIAMDWRAPMVKEGKQAEFLVFSSFPWQLVERIGVLHDATWRMTITALQQAAHRPRVEIIPAWYY